jgi:hypothetical protein
VKPFRPKFTDKTQFGQIYDLKKGFKYLLKSNIIVPNAHLNLLKLLLGRKFFSKFEFKKIKKMGPDMSFVKSIPRRRCFR